MGVLMERVMSATDARVHFGEVLQAVAEQGDSVIVERAGRRLAAVIPLSDYEHVRTRNELDERWARWSQAEQRLRELWETERTAGRLHDFDFVEAIRRGREERDEQLEDALRRR
jgi:prevent-host-death family protein